MRILLSFQLWLLPPLDEGKKRESSSRGWVLESFYCLRTTGCPCVGSKTWTTVSCGAMAPQLLRMRVPFPLFQLGHAKRRKKKSLNTSTRISMLGTGLKSQIQDS